MTLYRDDDGDSYGVSSDSKLGCMGEPGWSTKSGDCLDSNPQVNPGQQDFIGIPYKNASGNDSYDYNCDGSEKGDPALKLAPDCSKPSCSPVTGYGMSSKPGLGTNLVCGSTLQIACEKVSGQCTEKPSQALMPYGCN